MNNIWLSWGEVFNASLQDSWMGFAQFAPNFIIAVVFFVVGWVLGGIIAKSLEHVFNALKVDNLLKSVGVDDFFRKAEINLNSGYFLGQVVKWFIVIVFLLPSLNLVGLDSIGIFLEEDVLGFLPRVVVASLVLIIATIIAEGVSKTVSASAKTMSLTSANMLGTITKYSIWIFALIIALSQLGIADYYMSVLFTGIIAMLSIGGALAFGLGGKDAAARLIAKISDEVSHRS
ncbi:hypothetical protein A2641_01800 [Candidatus Nomurabacteria bacterium RIFCSPHIGHO2_01_FULL_37_25]|nr:MAG: hypothetical protein A2641_01800 [Candidatus Nomurabacteria bacterium RIFCSPHIGHO2_01_FULL_37_25]OGI76033.1 MAG: hypothetical protein A3D36_00675 [Candidatus Nomurabacteria bacterium RIFCSPHIGHO2_02_FULL_36_29]OGI96427.1 MAG: hypothetical protein A3I84_00130 [Candidatus Nomurabacteria bacterium RIFCSPLOWO2_02_FULL_36_8]